MTSPDPQARQQARFAEQHKAASEKLSDAALQDKTYQVVAPLVYLKCRFPDGEAIRAFYAGAAVPDTVPTEQLRHHLATGQIIPVGEDELLSAEDLEDRAIEGFRTGAAAAPPGVGSGQPDEPSGLPQHVLEDRRVRDLGLGGQQPVVTTPARRGRRVGERAGVSAEDTGAQDAPAGAAQQGDPDATAGPATPAQTAGTPGPETATTGGSGAGSQAPPPGTGRRPGTAK